MSDDMNTRIMKAEWEIEALKEGHRKHGDRMAEIVVSMDAHHQAIMKAIGELKDDRARAQGAAEARLLDAEMRQNRLKWLSAGLAAIGTLVALGWVGEAKAIVVNADMVDAPIPVQYYTRDLP